MSFFTFFAGLLLSEAKTCQVPLPGINAPESIHDINYNINNGNLPSIIQLKLEKAPQKYFWDNSFIIFIFIYLTSILLSTIILPSIGLQLILIVLLYLHHHVLLNKFEGLLFYVF